MRLLIGAGKPRFAQVLAERALLAIFHILGCFLRLCLNAGRPVNSTALLLRRYQ